MTDETGAAASDASSSAASTGSPSSTASQATDAAARRRGLAGAATQLGTEVSINFGSSLAGLVIPVVGSFVVVAVRQLVMVVAVLPFYRPKRAELTWRRLWPAIALGVVLAVMNLAFYESVHLLGLGVAATIEFLGPLALALASSRRVLDVICALAAGAGVFLLIGPGASDAAGIDPWGVALALTAAAAWAGYILLTRRVAVGLPGLEGLTVASLVSLVLLVPFAAATFDPAVIDWSIVAILLGVGVLSSALPYSLDTFILRRISPRIYAIITSFGPVIAAIFGWLVLSETFTFIEVVAIAVVCGAAGTALATQRGRPKSQLEQTAEGMA
ncbi:EamA family transporter [Agromyces badenianii]|uniref:EamA family transporter n=1 Tax=Agromyces badenianii TaxID=2080742 RepID=A0A2S0WSU1_9MICO|nr:EamA family transporter [Agromyces badenianii]AWB94314.1 EamA family transporter [Agromyces badenianii]PWC05675.1 EamA family transporter [Agromyces badenianii]